MIYQELRSHSGFYDSGLRFRISDPGFHILARQYSAQSLWDSVRAHDMFFFVCSATLFYLQRSSFLFAASLFFICSVPLFYLQRSTFYICSGSLFVCSASFLFAALLFCLQRFFFVCLISFLFAAFLFCLQRFFFVCSVSFLFASFLFCLQRFFFVCSVSFLFAACPLWTIVLISSVHVAFCGC